MKTRRFNMLQAGRVAIFSLLVGGCMTDPMRDLTTATTSTLAERPAAERQLPGGLFKAQAFSAKPVELQLTGKVNVAYADQKDAFWANQMGVGQYSLTQRYFLFRQSSNPKVALEIVFFEGGESDFFRQVLWEDVESADAEQMVFHVRGSGGGESGRVATNMIWNIRCSSGSRAENLFVSVNDETVHRSIFSFGVERNFWSAQFQLVPAEVPAQRIAQARATAISQAAYWSLETQRRLRERQQQRSAKS